MNTFYRENEKFMTLVSPILVNFCRTTIPLLLGVAQALGVSSVYVSDPSLITQLLFPNHSGQATPKEPQLPRALSRSAPRRFLSFPQGKRDDSYHLSDEQLNNLITKVSNTSREVCIWYYTSMFNARVFWSSFEQNTEWNNYVVGWQTFKLGINRICFHF